MSEKTYKDIADMTIEEKQQEIFDLYEKARDADFTRACFVCGHNRNITPHKNTWVCVGGCLQAFES